MLKEACDGGQMGGCSSLGAIEYKKGNIAQAMKFYKKACDGGEMGGCSNNLGTIEETKGNIAKSNEVL